MLFNLVMILLINILSTCLGNLKTVFLSQQAFKPVYITTFLDAMIFAYAFKLIAGSSGFGYIVSFALGRLIGVFLASRIEKKMALGLLEVSVYKHTEPGKILADQLRTAGYSVTTTIGYGWEGKQRLILNVILPRKQFSELQNILERHGKVNMSVKAINKTYGKLGNQRVLSGS